MSKRLSHHAGRIVVFCVLCGTSVLHAQSREAPRREDDRPSNDGFWPTQRMMELFMERGADDIARRYELSDDQYDVMLADMQERWPTFLRKHEKTLKPLVNEVFEMRLSGDMPSSEKAAEWAGKIIPILEEARKNIDEGSAVFSKVLNAEQKKRLQREMTEFNVGYTFLMTRAKDWKAGNFNGKDWPPERGRRNRNADRERRDRQQEAAATQPALEAPKSAWRRYVDRFIEAYELSDAQRASADNILRECEKSAAQVFKDYESFMSQLAKAPAAGADRSAVAAKRKSLDAEVQRRFADLKKRLEALLTSAQRARGSLDADTKRP